MVFISLHLWNFIWLVVGKKIIIQKSANLDNNSEARVFDDLITYLVISIIIGGRIGYVIFYNFNYYINNPLEIIKIWEGGMSFHGALIGIILGTYIFSKKNKIKVFFFLDIIACVAHGNISRACCKFYK